MEDDTFAEQVERQTEAVKKEEGDLDGSQSIKIVYFLGIGGKEDGQHDNTQS